MTTYNERVSLLKLGPDSVGGGRNRTMTGPVSMLVRIHLGNTDTRVTTLRGRMAWAVQELMAAGERGCTYLDSPAPRWPAYVYDLRALGVAIETVRESHDDPFAGQHARYVLRTQISVLEQINDAEPVKTSAIVRNGSAADAVSCRLQTRISARR